MEQKEKQDCKSDNSDNYEVAGKRACTLFLTYDQLQMIRKFGLSYDETWLYLTFFYRLCRICRQTGDMEWQDAETGLWHPAKFHQIMTVFDVLCQSREDCAPAGTFTSFGGLQYNQTFRSGTEFFQNYADILGRDLSGFNRVCQELGGREEKTGDAAWRLQLFDFLPVILQVWEPDEEFPANIGLLWDENILDFMHFETMFYAAEHVLETIVSLMDQKGQTAGV